MTPNEHAELAELRARSGSLNRSIHAIESRIAQLEGDEDRATFYRELGSTDLATSLSAYPRLLARRFLKGHPIPSIVSEEDKAAALALAEQMRPTRSPPCIVALIQDAEVAS